MTVSRSLPARPSFESLRKQAKKLARELAAGDADAVQRAHGHLPDVEPPLSLRHAQLVIAREYGFAGWRELAAEVNKRAGTGLQGAAAEARRVIHDNDIERLKTLLMEYPALLSWRDEENPGGVLGFATGSYGDSFDPERERQFTRADCAELLIDAGAVVMPSVCDDLIQSRARELLQLFGRKGLLPHTLKVFAARGDRDGVRVAAGQEGVVAGEIDEAFTVACDFHHEGLAAFLLDRSIALDAELGAKIDAGIGRDNFVTYFVENRSAARATRAGLWHAFVMEQARRAISSWSGPEISVARPVGHTDLPGFIRLLEREPWLLAESSIEFQAEVIERATLKNRPEFITALFERDAAILRRQPPPQSQAIEFAFTYAKTPVIPLLTRIWPLPDDLPHAAGMGDLSRVKQWFDPSGAPALGDLAHHYPSSPYMPKSRLEESIREWGPLSVQRVLDVAFAWSVINGHLDVADFLLQHGADINTTWSSHEPASILHELVFHANYESMQFLIDRGIDITIEDYRWRATAQGWALYAAKDENMARWLEDAQRRRALKQ